MVTERAVLPTWAAAKLRRQCKRALSWNTYDTSVWLMAAVCSHNVADEKEHVEGAARGSMCARVDVAPAARYLIQQAQLVGVAVAPASPVTKISPPYINAGSMAHTALAPAGLPLTPPRPAPAAAPGAPVAGGARTHALQRRRPEGGSRRRRGHAPGPSADTRAAATAGPAGNKGEQGARGRACWA